MNQYLKNYKFWLLIIITAGAVFLRGCQWEEVKKTYTKIVTIDLQKEKELKDKIEESEKLQIPQHIIDSLYNEFEKNRKEIVVVEYERKFVLQDLKIKELTNLVNSLKVVESKSSLKRAKLKRISSTRSSETSVVKPEKELVFVPNTIKIKTELPENKDSVIQSNIPDSLIQIPAEEMIKDSSEIINEYEPYKWFIGKFYHTKLKKQTNLDSLDVSK